MKKPAFIIAIAVLAALFSCTNSENSKEQLLKDVAAEEFHELIDSEKGVVLDVRTEEEVSEGRIEGAVNYNIFDDNFTANIRKLDKDQPVYVYCKAGGRSAKAAGLLKEEGFKAVYNLEGGITAWKAAGFEIK